MAMPQIETPAGQARRPRWRAVLLVVGLAVVLAELEALQFWFEHRNAPTRDSFAWRAWTILPPWLLLAGLVPLVGWLCRRFPPRAPSRGPILAHVVASLLFPVVHLGGLALLYQVLWARGSLLPRVADMLAFHYMFDVIAYWAIAATFLAVAFVRQGRLPRPDRPSWRAQFVVRDGGTMHVVPVDTVEWIEARNYCARLHARGGRFLIRESLRTLETQLDPAAFGRIHRSAIVNLERVSEVRLTEGRHVVVLRSGVTLPASRARWSGLRKRIEDGGWRIEKAVLALAVAVVFYPLSSILHPLAAQTTRNWRADERLLLTDLSFVTAVAATRNVIYAATSNGLAVYDRAMLSWKQTVGPFEGFPAGLVTAMAADPHDDTAWLAMSGRWIAYDPFTRRVDVGALPGGVDVVVLDARDPSRGAWFRTVAGWYFVARGSIAAMPARDVPREQIGGLSDRDLTTRLPARDAIRLRVERDEQQRGYRVTSAAAVPITNEVVLGTDGNGSWRVDPVTYQADRLPMGLLGSATGAVAASRGQICAAGDARIQSAHHGIACFDEGLRDFTYIERMGLGVLPGTAVRRLLVTDRAIWAATDQGLVRAPRRGGRPVQVLARDGLPGDLVYALAPAPSGVYAGTSGGIALVSDTGRGVVVAASATGPPVLALTPMGDDTVWAGTAAGVIGFLLPLGGPVVIPDGPSPLREPVVAIAARGDTIVAATETRFVVREGGAWRAMDVPGAPIGRLNAVAADDHGFWVAGTSGLAFFDPHRPLWNALVSPEDVVLPVRDVAASRDYVWIATEVGVVRYIKRILVP